MQRIYSVFFQTLVSGFYQRHAGVFLVFFLLMFGVIPPQNLLSYHQKLMEAFLSDTILRIMVFLCWFVYSLKCMQFTSQQLEKKEQEFLFEVNALKKTQRFFISFIVLSGMLLPIWAYALIAVFYAFCSDFISGAPLQILFFSISISIFSAFVIDNKISNRQDIGLNKWLNFLSIRIKKSYPVIMLLQILHDLKVVFFATKFFSIICLYIAFAFCDARVYDIRVILLGLLFSMLAHVTLLFELRKFEETQLLFMRNAPQTILKKLIHYIIIILILLIPEFLVMTKVVPDKILWQQLPALFVFCISLMLSFISTMYKLPFNKDKTIIYPTYIVLVVFFLILYKAVHLVIVGLILFSAITFFRNYFKFELIEEK